MSLILLLMKGGLTDLLIWQGCLKRRVSLLRLATTTTITQASLFSDEDPEATVIVDKV